MFCAIQKWSNETRYTFYWSVFKLFKYEWGNRNEKKRTEMKLKPNEKDERIKWRKPHIQRESVRERKRIIWKVVLFDVTFWEGKEWKNCQNQYTFRCTTEMISIIFFFFFFAWNVAFNTSVRLRIFVIVISIYWIALFMHGDGAYSLLVGLMTCLEKC